MYHYESDQGNLDIALLGDCILTRKLSVFRESRYLEMVNSIRKNDLVLANSEMLFHEYQGTPAWDHGGTHMASDPNNISELHWLGVSMISCANNHANDYGPRGVLDNISNLDKFNMPHAGTGRHLTEATSPTYLDTPRGRIALISVTATLPANGSYAGEPTSLDRGRPGANVLRHNIQYVVPKQDLNALRKISEGLGFEKGKKRLVVSRNPGLRTDDENNFQFLNTNFAPYPKFEFSNFTVGDEYKVITTPNVEDLNRNIKWIENAKHFADWVIVSIHVHDCGKEETDSPDFVKEFAHKAIDAGTDIFVSHGSHHSYQGSRGIELYNGKPIFHGLGGFITQSSVKWSPWDAYQRYGITDQINPTPSEFETRRSSIGREYDVDRIGMHGSSYVSMQWERKECVKILVHPVTTSSQNVSIFKDRSRGTQGRPMPAQGEIADDIINRIAEMSSEFDISIAKENDIGVINLNK